MAGFNFDGKQKLFSGQIGEAAFYGGILQTHADAEIGRGVAAYGPGIGKSPGQNKLFMEIARIGSLKDPANIFVSEFDHCAVGDQFIARKSLPAIGLAGKNFVAYPAEGLLEISKYLLHWSLF